MGSSDENVDILVIGGGVAGLGAATRLHQLNNTDWLLLESEQEAGGLASTDVTKEGFLFDRGGHVIFSHYEYFDQLLDECMGSGEKSWSQHQRVSYISTNKRMIPYPFQLNLHKLPLEDMIKCLEGLFEANVLKKMGAVQKPKTFNEWIDQFLGKGIGDVFMRPYNYKVWAIHPDQMQCRWLGERVATVDTTRVLTNIIQQKDDAGWGPNATFRFPQHGGTGAIWKAVAKRLPKERMRYGSKVQNLNLQDKSVTLTNGSIIKYNKLLSTIPLEILLNIAGEKERAEKASNGLFHSSTHIIGFGIRGDHKLGDLKWCYFPDEDVNFNRATVFSGYAKANCPSDDTKLPAMCLAGGKVTEAPANAEKKPGPYWSLMLEINESTIKHVDRDNIVQDSLDSCVRSGILDEGSEIVSIHNKCFEYGYPTPVLTRDEVLEEMLPWLQERSVWSRGRFGSYKYEVSNQDHSLMVGVEAVDNILSGTEEFSLNRPDYVNARDSPNRGRLQFTCNTVNGR